MMAYFDVIVSENRPLQLQALRWIRGDINTKTEAKKELGIAKIITDDNWFLMIKNLSELFAGLGYAGFVIDFDRSEEHTSELQSRFDIVCRLLLEKKKNFIILTVM